MGQPEIYEILKRNPDNWYTVEDLSKILKDRKTAVQSHVRKLRKSNIIECVPKRIYKKVPPHNNKTYSRRMVYYYRIKLPKREYI